MDAPVRQPTNGKGMKDPALSGSVADFIELVNTAVGKHFKCCICFSIFKDPVMLPCNHALCRDCAAQSFRQKQRCPQCLADIPNLRTLQGRNSWIKEMVDSLRNCLNEVGASLTQHAPVPLKYENAHRPATGARSRARTLEVRRARPPSPPFQAMSCKGSSGGNAKRKGKSGRASRKRLAASHPPALALSAHLSPPNFNSERSEGGADSPSASYWSRLGDVDDNLEGADEQLPEGGEGHEKVSPRPPTSSNMAVPFTHAPPPLKPFVVGDLVHVEHRTWPGMNKHGGVGLVCGVLDPPGSAYNVKYSVTQKVDRDVEACHVHAHSFPVESVGARYRRGCGGRAKINNDGGSGGVSRSDGGLSTALKIRKTRAVRRSAAASTVAGGVSAAFSFSSSTPSNERDHVQATPRLEDKVKGKVEVPPEAQEGTSGSRGSYNLVATSLIGSREGVKNLSDAEAGGFESVCDINYFRASREEVGGSNGSKCGEGVPEARSFDSDGRGQETVNLKKNDEPRACQIIASAEEINISEKETEEAATAAVKSLPCFQRNPPQHLIETGSHQERDLRQLRRLVTLSDADKRPLDNPSGRVSSREVPTSPEEESFGIIDDDETPSGLLHSSISGSLRSSLGTGPLEPSRTDTTVHSIGPSRHSSIGYSNSAVHGVDAERARIDANPKIDASSASNRVGSQIEMARIGDDPLGGLSKSLNSSPSLRTLLERRDISVAASQHTSQKAMPPPSPLLSPSDLSPSWLSSPPPVTPSKTPAYKIGDFVAVLSRSSPGVNKEGGVARITQVRPGGMYDVKYLLRKGNEKYVIATILSPYSDAKVDEAATASGGSKSGGRRDNSKRATVSSLTKTGTPVRRTHRTNKGSCPPDAAAGQANAACLSYMLGETQHPELDLDPDLGEELDPDEVGLGGDRRRGEPATAAKEAEEIVPVSNSATHGSGRGNQGKIKSGEEEEGGGAVRKSSNSSEGRDSRKERDGNKFEGGKVNVQEFIRDKRRLDNSANGSDGTRSKNSNVRPKTALDTRDFVGAKDGPQSHGRRNATTTLKKRSRHLLDRPSTGKGIEKEEDCGAIERGSAVGADNSRGGEERRSSSTRRGQTTTVVLTLSSSAPQMMALAESLAKRYGWKVEPKYTEAVTHVVCGATPQTNKANTRSSKFLRAVASGKWVVNEAWLQECKRRGTRAKEEPFEISGDKKSTVPSAPRRSRLAHAETDRPGLFHGTTFHFRGEFGRESPSLSELQPMLLANGGAIVETIGALFTHPQQGERVGNGSGVGVKRHGTNNNSGNRSWRPQRVVIFQPPTASPGGRGGVLASELANLAEAGLSLGSEGAGGIEDGITVEVVKPLWLVDSVGSFRVLKPTVLHRVDLLDECPNSMEF